MTGPEDHRWARALQLAKTQLRILHEGFGKKRRQRKNIEEWPDKSGGSYTLCGSFGEGKWFKINPTSIQRATDLLKRARRVCGSSSIPHYRNTSAKSSSSGTKIGRKNRKVPTKVTRFD